MYDFWYATGVAIMRPNLLDVIEGAQPTYKFVKRRLIETDKDGNETELPDVPGSGLMEKESATRVRLAVAGFIRAFSPAAPPVGIYTAGRFCQLFALGQFSSNHADSTFRDIINFAGNAYKTALHAGPESSLPAFPAFLGAILMDGAIGGNLATPSVDQEEVAAEFDVLRETRDREIAVNFAEHPDLIKASRFLMVEDRNPWQRGTGEQMFFWKDRSERAIP